MNDVQLAMHTSNVYNLVCWFVGAYTIGAYLTMFISGYTYAILMASIVASLVFTFLFASAITDSSKFNYGMLTAGSMGTMCGHIIQYANIIDDTILPLSVTITLGVFGTMTFITQFVTDSQMLMLGGFLSSVLSGLIIFGFFSMFFTVPEIVHDIRLLVGFITFCGYITYDTYKMREKFRQGKIDYYEHAMSLFLDMVNIFVKVLSHLVKYKRRDESGNKKKK